MQYEVGQIGRVVAARLYEGEDLYECVEGIGARERIDCAVVLITGGCRKADVVVGPKQESPRIVADFRAFAGPGEAVVLAGRASARRLQERLDEPLALKAGEKRVDAALAEQHQTSVLKLAGHLVTVGGLLGDHRQEAHVEHPSQELAGPFHTASISLPCNAG